MSQRWLKYVRDSVEASGGPIPFALARWQFEAPVIATILRELPAGGRILEVGCGSGLLTGLLAHHGFDVVGIDDDMDIVDYARQMVDYLRSPVRIERADARDLSKYYDAFDLVFSLGVVEHFEAADTARLIEEQARCAKCVVVCIPTRLLKLTGKATDERFYTRYQLEDFLRRAGLEVRRSIVYGDVPTWFGRGASILFPKVLYRGMRHFATYGMGICSVGRRRYCSFEQCR